jgi:hypothetical protein
VALKEDIQMIDWTYVLTPLLVLPIVLLFRFVGCTAFTTTAAETSPKYKEYILGLPNNPGTVKNPAVVPNGADVIGYWRLIDVAGNTSAQDEASAGRHGQYVVGNICQLRAPTATAPGSEGRAPGKFIEGQDSLILSEPGAKCRYFDGGYVRIAHKPAFYSEQFTLEAWVFVDRLAAGYEHVLFDAGGNYGTPPAERGFQIVADRDGHWQVRLAPGTAFLFAAPPLVPLNTPTHMALTVENDGAPGGKKKVTLYVDGKVGATGTVNSYNLPDTAPLFIGLENHAPSPVAGTDERSPVLCRVQEVVLHRKVLSKEEIENHVDINRKSVTGA